jgi:predicted XRE-type DNA-binding protein
MRPADVRLAIVASVADELGALEWRSVVLRDRLYDAVRDAVEAGFAQVRVAEAAGVSRQRVGQIMAMYERPEQEVLQP